MKKRKATWVEIYLAVLDCYPLTATAEELPSVKVIEKIKLKRKIRFDFEITPETPFEFRFPIVIKGKRQQSRTFILKLLGENVVASTPLKNIKWLNSIFAFKAQNGLPQHALLTNNATVKQFTNAGWHV